MRLTKGQPVEHPYRGPCIILEDSEPDTGSVLAVATDMEKNNKLYLNPVFSARTSLLSVPVQEPVGNTPDTQPLVILGQGSFKITIETPQTGGK